MFRIKLDVHTYYITYTYIFWYYENSQSLVSLIYLNSESCRLICSCVCLSSSVEIIFGFIVNLIKYTLVCRNYSFNWIVTLLWKNKTQTFLIKEKSLMKYVREKVSGNNYWISFTLISWIIICYRVYKGNIWRRQVHVYYWWIS